MTEFMPIKKPPRFLPFSSNSKGTERLFIYHTQDPKVLVEIVTDPTTEDLADFLSDAGTRKLFSKRIKGHLYDGFAISLDPSLRTGEELEKMATRLQDWFIAYLMKDSGQ